MPSRKSKLLYAFIHHVIFEVTKHMLEDKWKRISFRAICFIHIASIFDDLVQWLETRSNAFEPTYLYTMEKVREAS